MLEDNLAKLSAIALKRLGQQRISVRATEDLSEFEECMTSIGKKHNYPMISVSCSDIERGDAFGLLLSEFGGGLIGGVAARVIPLGKGNLSEHLRSSYRRLYGSISEPAISLHSDAPDYVRGRVVYEGELYLCPDWRGGKVNVPALMHYLHTLCVSKWQPDWIFGFIRSGGISRAPDYGFSQQYPGAVRWSVNALGRGDDECLVLVRPVDLSASASRFIGNPSSFIK